MVGKDSSQLSKHQQRFFQSIADIFETWVSRRKNPHTQRSYRTDVMTFIEYLGIAWPDEAIKLLQVSVKDVTGWRDLMTEKGQEAKAAVRVLTRLLRFCTLRG